MGIDNVMRKGVKIHIDGDREREFMLGFAGIGYLAQKHGSVKKAFAKMGNQKDMSEMTEAAIEILKDFIYAGLLRDATRQKEKLTDEMIYDLMDMGLPQLMGAISDSVKNELPETNENGNPTNPQT